MGRWEKADKNNEKLSYHKGFRGINCITNENFFGGRHFHSPLCRLDYIILDVKLENLR